MALINSVINFRLANPSFPGHMSRSCVNEAVGNFSSIAFVPQNVIRRENGIVTKLNLSSGFIRPNARDTEVFFSMSEIIGPGCSNVHVGDMVEFEFTYNGENGKPCAKGISKKASSIRNEEISNHRLRGYIVNPAQRYAEGTNRGSGEAYFEQKGAIMFEFGGVFYYLPYSLKDCKIPSSSQNPTCNDLVSFHIARAPKDTHPRAINVALEQDASEKLLGIISSLRTSYGFIERLDTGQEIFFHFNQVLSDCPCAVGNPVEFTFNYNVKRGEEPYASNVFILPDKPFHFETVLPDMIRGTVTRTIHGSHINSVHAPATGCVITEPSVEHCVLYEFSHRNVVGDFTLYLGDIVMFNVAVDRRFDKELATNIQLLPETFKSQNEMRYTGYIVSVSSGFSSSSDFGYIKCAETLENIKFWFGESLDPQWKPAPRDEVEFSTVKNCNHIPSPLHPLSPRNNVKLSAVRIRPLPTGSVKMKEDNMQHGIVIREALASGVLGDFENAHPEASIGLISSEDSVFEFKIESVTDVGRIPKMGDIVEFYGNQDSEQMIAVNVQVMKNRSFQNLQGYVATLKDSFGFIEASTHDQEIFFHCTSFLGDFNKLRVGDEVKYKALRKNGRMAAHDVSLLTKGTVNPELVYKKVYHGIVDRPLRLVNPQQAHYAGIVRILDDTGSEKSNETYEYGVTGLDDPCDYLQTGDKVTFCLAMVYSTGELRATRVAGLRTLHRAKVQCIKSGYGFLDVDVPPSLAEASPSTDDELPFAVSPQQSTPGSLSSGRKLFFHISEVRNNEALKVGDIVDYVLIKNQLNGRFAACSLRKVNSSEEKCDRKPAVSPGDTPTGPSQKK